MMDGGSEVSRVVIGAAMAVHSALGPGLLESTYEACLFHELTQRSVAVERQRVLPVVYRGVVIDCGYRVDLLVADDVIVEIKAVQHVQPVHRAQLMTYLRLSGRHVGLLLNFNVDSMRNGTERIVHTSHYDPRG